MSKLKPAPLPSGTVVGGYQIVKKLAAGGFGVVYLAEDAQRHMVAVKEYLPSSLAERSQGELTPRVKPDKQPLYRLGLKSFFEEGRSLAQISHPSVVSVLNFFRENETVYMVMNYLQGETLQDFHRHRARPEARQGVPRVDHPVAVRRDPAWLAHRASAQDAAPRHQARQHLHHQ
ncbi:MAG: protein kinase [Burkholderiaceae bacterium]